MSPNSHHNAVASNFAQTPAGTGYQFDLDTLRLDGQALFEVGECADRIMDTLTPEQIQYAEMPARGEFQGWGALHDLTDANCLLPGVETTPSLCGEGVIDHPAVIAFWDAVRDLVSSHIGERANGREKVNYMTKDAEAAWAENPNEREDPRMVEMYSNSYGDQIDCMETEREDFERSVEAELTSDVIDDALFARFVGYLREEALLVEDATSLNIPGFGAHSSALARELVSAVETLRGEPVRMYTPGRTVYWLTSDIHNAGFDTDVFGSEAEFEAHLCSIMNDRCSEVVEWDSHHLSSRAERILMLISLGEVNEAWGEFRGDNHEMGRPVHCDEDHYIWGETFLAD